MRPISTLWMVAACFRVSPRAASPPRADLRAHRMRAEAANDLIASDAQFPLICSERNKEKKKPLKKSPRRRGLSQTLSEERADRQRAEDAAVGDADRLGAFPDGPERLTGAPGCVHCRPAPGAPRRREKNFLLLQTFFLPPLFSFFSLFQRRKRNELQLRISSN